MEESFSASAQSIAQCSACFTNVTADDVYCTNCGYPLKGTETEKRNFITARDFRDIDMESFNKRVKRAGNALYYLSGLFIFYAIICFFIKKDAPEVLGIVIPYLILGILFLVLGSFSSKKPLACLICGLSLYIIVTILLIMNDPTNLVRGIIFKIIIIGYLLNGIKSAIELEKIKKENNIS